ncbi:undecaprenyl-diphosphatase [Ruminococcaceae bacterium R-25]|nr:undecaprenyl-diphosphatase [Ruminococcaceae bacterium R-25]SUQ11179.1 undecaprenyl-diphosphatase [Oscillospiraceae bacterium]
MFWDYFVAFIFGVVEGITEWLPVSSTGHMIILNEFLKLNVSPEFYDLYLVVIQLGAIMAVVVIFWKEIWPFGIKNNEHPFSKTGIGRYVMKDKIILWLKIALACVPAAIIGVLFDDWLDEHLYNYFVVAIALIVFGVAFIVVEYLMKNRNPVIKTVGQLNWGHALAIGLFQLLAAIFPGASRSGSTIVGSIAIGIKREAAAKFTFFLAIPVMFGASLLKIIKYDGGVTAHEVGLLLVGMITAFFVSLLIIKQLMAFIKKHTFSCFGWYRIGLGILVLILGACGIIGGVAPV